MSELAIAEGIQTVIRALAAFESADVVINDWGILDQPNPAAPYVILATSDTFTSSMDTPEDRTDWQIPVTLYEYFTDWTTTLNNFRTRRQAVLDTFNAVGTARSAGGLEGVNVRVIRSEGPITPYYPPGTPASQIPEQLPLYLYQSMLFDVEEF